MSNEVQFVRGKVLLVDDAPDSLLAMRRTLASTGAELFTATGGVEAMSLLLRHGFSVILLDVNMPGMSGFELAEHVRSQPESRLTPILFLTGASQERFDVEQGYEVGAVDYLFKPVDPMVLVAKVRAFLELERARADLRSALERVALQNAALARLNDEKTRFLGMAAHDLRNPLSVVAGFAGLLELEGVGPLNARQRDFVGRIIVNSRFMQGLVDDFLDVSRIESGQLGLNPVLTEVGPWARSIVDDFARLSKAKEIAVTLVVPDGAFGTFDPARMAQVLGNLLSNAIKYSVVKTSTRIEITVGDEIRISVRDEGQGIRDEEQAALFEPFARASNRPTGGESSTGLGLVISKRIVEAHGGRIVLDSAVGKGSCFTVTWPQPLPVAEQSQEPQPPLLRSR
jgi:signal transduction histidine kinase